MAGPARITIELEAPPHPRGRWRARTRVDNGGTPAVAGPAAPVVEMVEPREPAVEPAAYEPLGECTCVEGYCDADHANE